MKWFVSSLVVLTACVMMTDSVGIERVRADDAKKESSAEKKKSKLFVREDLEKAFSKKLSGSALVGTFSIDGQKDDKPPRAERYELKSVTKLKGDYWVFVARIKYGKTNLSVPITIKVLWAGDTPMISLTDLSIPGLGTFTARVMFYGDRYAGTWQHGKVGGHMWGRIEQAKMTDKPKSTKKKSAK